MAPSHPGPTIPSFLLHLLPCHRHALDTHAATDLKGLPTSRNRIIEWNMKSPEKMKKIQEINERDFQRDNQEIRKINCKEERLICEFAL